MKKTIVLAVLTTLCALFSAASALAGFSLQITEIWPGNDPGSNLTEDWFEITNFGDDAWHDSTNPMWYDDVSADTGDAVPMTGISTIAPGESVIYVLGNSSSITQWIALWAPVLSTVPQVGSFAGGSGLGQGGDGVAVWIGALSGSPDLYSVYPDASGDGGQSWDTLLGEFSVPGNASGAVATIGLNNANQPAIGSPGMAVPEPSTITLAGIGALGLLGLAYRRRRAK